MKQMNLTACSAENIAAQRVTIPSEFTTPYHKDKKIAPSKNSKLLMVMLVCYSETVCIVYNGANELSSFLIERTGIFRLRGCI